MAGRQGEGSGGEGGEGSGGEGGRRSERPPAQPRGEGEETITFEGGGDFNDDEGGEPNFNREDANRETVAAGRPDRPDRPRGDRPHSGGGDRGGRGGRHRRGGSGGGRGPRGGGDRGPRGGGGGDRGNR